MRTIPTDRRAYEMPPWYVLAPILAAGFRVGWIGQPTTEAIVMLHVAMCGPALILAVQYWPRDPTPPDPKPHALPLVKIGRFLRLDPYRPGGPLDPQKPRKPPRRWRWRRK